MFKEHDCFRLRKPIAEEVIPVGMTGVVLLVLSEPYLAYEVEFVDENGHQLGSTSTFTLTEDFMESISD